MASSISPSPAFHSPSSSSSTRFDAYPHNSRLSFPGPTKFIPPHPRFTRPSSSSLTCRCLSSNNNDGSTSDVPSPSDKDSRRWIQDGLRNAIQWLDGVVSAYTNNNSSSANLSDDVDVDAAGRESMVNSTDGKDGEWDWERWKQHFTEVDDQERIVSILKSQLTRAIFNEDYEDAARLKVAIAAAATNDTVGSVMAHLNKAIEDERYLDAAFIRDYAGAGLVGWWAGLSDDRNDPYGRIIRIRAEHGRYVAKSFSPRQLATATEGTPLFEIFLKRNKKGEYKQQAVYLKQIEVPQDSPNTPSKSSILTNSLDPLDPLSNKDDLFAKTVEETEDNEDSDDDSDITEESVFENIPQDMIPGVKDLKVKVFNMPMPGKIDRDMISRVVEQIMKGEDERDLELNLELEGKDAEDDLEGESDDEKNDIEVGSGHAVDEKEAKNQIAFQILVSGLDRISRGTLLKDLLRVPARLERKSCSSFSFSIKQDDRQVSGRDAQSLLKKKAKLRGNRSIDKALIDFEESIYKGEMSMKMLIDFSQLLKLTARLVQRPQPFSGSTTFNRIDFPTSPDPLNALYVGVHGIHNSEVIHLRRKFGQWQEDGRKNEFPNLEVYEYVEALKLTGDPDVPAGQVAFRAKIGKRYQLPHKGIIPEEFGVVARYRGQGRLAEPGFKNPRWVDGELVILDGKFSKGRTLVGFVYWAPEYHFLVFFNQLRLQN